MVDEAKDDGVSPELRKPSQPNSSSHQALRKCQPRAPEIQPMSGLQPEWGKVSRDSVVCTSFTMTTTRKFRVKRNEAQALESRFGW